MIRHLFKLIWNRKRANVLVISEIFVCFLVLFAVLTQALYTLSNYRKPVGFDYENVSAVSIVSCCYAPPTKQGSTNYDALWTGVAGAA